MEIVKKILHETVEKLRAESIYPEEILDTISKLKPSKSFLNFISKVFGLFCRKRNQDAMLAMFYGEIVKGWRVYFPPCNNQKAINVLLIHLPQKLIAYHKNASNEQQNEVSSWVNNYSIRHFRRDVYFKFIDLRQNVNFTPNGMNYTICITTPIPTYQCDQCSRCAFNLEYFFRNWTKLR